MTLSQTISLEKPRHSMTEVAAPKPTFASGSNGSSPGIDRIGGLYPGLIIVSRVVERQEASRYPPPR